MALDISDLAATSVYMPGFQPFMYFAPTTQMHALTFPNPFHPLTITLLSPPHADMFKTAEEKTIRDDPWVCAFCNFTYFISHRCEMCDHFNVGLFHALNNDREHYRAQFAKHRFFVIKDLPQSIWNIIAQYISCKYYDDMPPLVDIKGTV